MKVMMEYRVPEALREAPEPLAAEMGTMAIELRMDQQIPAGAGVEAEKTRQHQPVVREAEAEADMAEAGPEAEAEVLQPITEAPEEQQGLPQTTQDLMPEAEAEEAVQQHRAAPEEIQPIRPPQAERVPELTRV